MDLSNPQSIQDLFNHDFKKLPANVSLIMYGPKVPDEHYRVSKKSNNTRMYWPMSFYKTIAPVMSLN